MGTPFPNESMQRRRVLESLAVASCAGLAGCTALTDTESTPTDARSTPDPTEDVDGDGFTVCEERHLLDGAEVGRMDVYVEVDWTAGNRPDPDEIDRLVEVYDTAPVSASHGADPGVNLHVVYGDEVPARSEPFGLGELGEYEREHFDNAGRGYHYALFVDEVEPPALGRQDEGGFLVQSGLSESRSITTIQVFAHELGHSLGLTTDVFEGVDGGEHYTSDQYPSVMNDAAVGRDGFLDFSDGTSSEVDFDDWGYLADNLTVPDDDELGDC